MTDRMKLLIMADAFGLEVYERENSIFFAKRRYTFNAEDEIIEIYDGAIRMRFGDSENE